jgi:hypothetical protein
LIFFIFTYYILKKKRKGMPKFLTKKKMGGNGKKIVEQLRDTSEKVRVTALKTLIGSPRETFTKDVLQAMKERLTDDHGDVRSAAASALGEVIFETEPSFTKEIHHKLLERLNVEDFDEARAEIINALPKSETREEDLLVVMQNLLPQLRTTDGKIIPFKPDRSDTRWMNKIRGKIVYFPRTQEAAAYFLTEMMYQFPSKVNMAKITKAIADIVKDVPAFRVLTSIIRIPSESVFIMKNVPNPGSSGDGKILMYFHP